jgi:hypothetical protein
MGCLRPQSRPPRTTFLLRLLCRFVNRHEASIRRRKRTRRSLSEANEVRMPFQFEEPLHSLLSVTLSTGYGGLKWEQSEVLLSKTSRHDNIELIDCVVFFQVENQKQITNCLTTMMRKVIFCLTS